MFSTRWIILFNIATIFIYRTIVQYININLIYFYAIRTLICSLIIFKAYKINTSQIKYIIRNNSKIVAINALIYSTTMLIIDYDPSNATLCFSMFGIQKYFCTNYETEEHKKVRLFFWLSSVVALVLITTSDILVSITIFCFMSPMHILFAKIKKNQLRRFKLDFFMMQPVSFFLSSLMMFAFGIFRGYKINGIQVLKCAYIMPVISILHCWYMLTSNTIFLHGKFSKKDPLYPWFDNFDIYSSILTFITRSYSQGSCKENIDSDPFVISVAMLFISYIFNFL